MIEYNNSNPLDFESDLTSEQLCQLDVYTQLARNRLLERDVSIADLKKDFYSGKNVIRPPLTIADFPSRLVGVKLNEYYTNTVTHYKAYCAALARFGQDYVFTYTVNWEYKFVKILGGEVSILPHKAPETSVYPFSTSEDLKKALSINFDDLVAEDLALKRYTDKKLDDLIGPGQFVTLDPFSEVCALLRNPENFMMDIMTNPKFVHELCTFIFEVQKEVLKRILAAGPATFFMPGYTLMLSPKQFEEFAMPYINKLVEAFPGVTMIIGSGGNATHLIELFMKSKTPIIFIDAASDYNVAVEMYKKYSKPFAVLFPRSVLMNGDKHEIRNVTRKMLSSLKEVPFCWWTEAILGGDVPNPIIDFFIEAYNEYAKYPLDKYLADEPINNKLQDITAEVDLKDIIWEKDAEEALKKNVPYMFRKLARNEVEKMAASDGIRVINADVFEQFKKKKGY